MHRVILSGELDGFIQGFLIVLPLLVMVGSCLCVNVIIFSSSFTCVLTYNLNSCCYRPDCFEHSFAS